MSNNLTIANAERILWELSDLDQASATPERRLQICEALDYLTRESDYHIFGICAESTSEAFKSLQAFAKHFRYELPPSQDLPVIVDGAYLKYNPRRPRYHFDNYKGNYRGVLISFHTDFSDGYSGTHGHFPLDLFHG